MFNVEQTLVEFTQAILLNKAIIVNDSGEWAFEAQWRRCARQFFGRELARTVRIAQLFSSILDGLERIPVRFSSTSVAAGQMRDFKSYIRAAEAILAKLALCKAPFAFSAYQKLKMQTIALKYRLEAVNGGVNPQAPCLETQKLLRMHAENWKKTLEIACERCLTDEELLSIEDLSRFPEFTDILLKNEDARLNFFNWSLRDGIPVSIFVEYPALRHRLVQCGLSGRIGRMGGGDVLKLEKKPLSSDLIEKIVTLPFEGTAINVLDGMKIIVFRGGYKASIFEVFETFRNKHLRVGDFEFMHEGIINWNVQKWGWWNAEKRDYDVVDVTTNGWWKLLPFFEVISLQQAKELYRIDADGEHWIAAATATRGRATLDVDLTHAYLEVAIPINGAHYAILDLGKQANEFPATYLDALTMACKTVHATIAYPDENVYYTHRQHAQHAFLLTPEEGVMLMDAIKKDVISSRGLNFVYQIESENCAKWVHEKLEASLGVCAVPNLFKMSIFHTEPISFLRTIINFCKIFPVSWQIKVLTFFHLPLGAAQGHWVIEHGQLVWRALTHHSFWKTGTIYLPCFLHRQKELGFLEIKETLFEKLTGIQGGGKRGTRDESKDPSETSMVAQAFGEIVSGLILLFYVLFKKRSSPSASSETQAARLSLRFACQRDRSLYRGVVGLNF